MDSFLVKIKSEEELINGIKMLADIGALGAEICFGTCLSDSYNVYDIINKELDIWCEPYDDEDICAFNISYDYNEYRNSKFPDLYGKNNILVSLATKYDIKMGDIPKEKVKYNKMIDEAEKLIKSKQK